MGDISPSLAAYTAARRGASLPAAAVSLVAGAGLDRPGHAGALQRDRRSRGLGLSITALHLNARLDSLVLETRGGFTCQIYTVR